MVTRAKFRCNSIKLMRTSTIKPGLEYDYDTRKYKDAEGNEFSQAEAYAAFDQPTVELLAVTGDTAENKAFFAATPTARIELTISNPAAAETFELGKEYYCDFSPADV